MADPIITDWFRAQVILHGKSGLPEDVYVNSFAFRNDVTPVGGPDLVAGRITSVLASFYNDPVAPSADYVAKFLATTFIAPEATVKVYDLGEATPRTPYENTFTLATMGGSPLPEEVACCLSFYADKNTPRSRGRIFLGPLSTAAMSSTGTRVVPNATLRSALAAAAQRMVEANGGDVTWGLISQADLAAKVITAGWVDDAFDTMRKRGSSPTTRTVFPPVV